MCKQCGCENPWRGRGEKLVKNKPFSITDKETIAEYKAEVWRLKKELEIRDSAARAALEKNDALQKEVNMLITMVEDLKRDVADLREVSALGTCYGRDAI